MTTPSKPPLEVEAQAWLVLLACGRERIEPFLIWRSNPANAKAFDQLAASQFAVWDAERNLVLARLQATPETLEEKRNRLIDRLSDLEALILTVRSSALSAIRAKAGVLLYRFREQYDEEAPAMEDICDFIEAAARARAPA